MNALALAIQALQSLITLIPLGQELKAMYDGIVSSLQSMQASGRDPTDAEWEALNTAVRALEAQLAANS